MRTIVTITPHGWIVSFYQGKALIKTAVAEAQDGWEKAMLEATGDTRH